MLQPGISPLVSLSTMTVFSAAIARALTGRGTGAVGLAGTAAAAHLLQAGRIAKGAGAVFLDILARVKGVGASFAPVAERPDMIVEEAGHRLGVAVVLPAGALAVALAEDVLVHVFVSKGLGHVKTHRKKVVHPPPRTELALSPLPFMFPGMCQQAKKWERKGGSIQQALSSQRVSRWAAPPKLASL